VTWILDIQGMKGESLDVQRHTGELDKLFTAILFSSIGHSASTSGNAEKLPEPILSYDKYTV
jgi:hypothetical protein